MSAYDNPTIIKDDSAMAWANGIASFGENFMKARAARQALDLQEKAYEDKLKAETKKTAIAIQSANIEQGLSNQKEIGAAVDQMEKTKIDTVIQDQWKSNYAQLNEQKGDFNVLAKFTELNKDQIAEGAKFAESVAQFKDKSLSGLAANQTNVNEWATLSPRDRANTAFMGNTPLERKISEITLYSSNPANYNWKGKVDKKLYKENDNPANPGIEIITKVDLAKDLKGFTVEELEKEASKPNGSIIIDEKTVGDKTIKQYSVRFKQKLGDPSWDGQFYHKVAEAPDPNKIWGKDQANIVNDKGELNNSFIINPGNPVVTKEKVPGFPNKENMVETTYVNVPEIRKNAKQYYDFGAEALLSSDLKDMTQLQSFLQTKLNRGNESLADWIKKYPTPEDQKKFISNKLFEIDMENKLTSSGDQYSNRPATEEDVKAGRADIVGESVYYTQKAQEVAAPRVTNVNVNGGNNKPTAAEVGQTNFNKIITNGIKSGKAIKGKDGLYLKVTNGKGVLYRIDATGLKIPVDTTGDDLQDMINEIGGTIQVDNMGRKKIK
jgi:hypothetical protein